MGFWVFGFFSVVPKIHNWLPFSKIMQDDDRSASTRTHQLTQQNNIKPMMTWQQYIQMKNPYLNTNRKNSNIFSWKQHKTYPLINQMNNNNDQDDDDNGLFSSDDPLSKDSFLMSNMDLFDNNIDTRHRAMKDYNRHNSMENMMNIEKLLSKNLKGSNKMAQFGTHPKDNFPMHNFYKQLTDRNEMNNDKHFHHSRNIRNQELGQKQQEQKKSLKYKRYPKIPIKNKRHHNNVNKVII